MQAEEDLGWYHTGLGHPYMDPLMKLYPEYRQKEINETIESKEVARTKLDARRCIHPHNLCIFKRYTLTYPSSSHLN